jgi:dienelactone hydrolase
LFACLRDISALGVGSSTDRRFRNEVADYKTHFGSPNSNRGRNEDHEYISVSNSFGGLESHAFKTPLHARVRTFEYDEYSIGGVDRNFPRILFGRQSVPARGTCRPAPAVLIPRTLEAWTAGKSAIYSVPALGVNLARQGYVAFAYDMVGFNDTRQTPHSFETAAYSLWGFHPMGLQLWNSIRALDYLQSLPEVDGSRIAVTGASGGGSQTIFLTAVDDRIKVSAPVNMVSAEMQGGDPCEEAPNLRLGTSNVELWQVTERPMLVVSSTHDWTRHTPVEEYPSIRKIYELYGRAQDVENVHIDAEHNYNRQSREAVYRFLAVHMQRALLNSELVERDFQLPPEQNLLAFPAGDLPPGTGNTAEVFQNWKIAARLRIEDGASAGELRESLRQTLGAEIDPEVEATVRATRLSDPNRQTRPSYRLLVSERALRIVDANGARLARGSQLAKEVIGTGRPV